MAMRDGFNPTEWQVRYQRFIESLQPEQEHANEKIATEELADQCENTLLIAIWMLYQDDAEREMIARIMQRHSKLMIQFGMTCMSIGYALAMQRERVGR